MSDRGWGIGERQPEVELAPAPRRRFSKKAAIYMGVSIVGAAGGGFFGVYGMRKQEDWHNLNLRYALGYEKIIHAKAPNTAPNKRLVVTTNSLSEAQLSEVGLSSGEASSNSTDIYPVDDLGTELTSANFSYTLPSLTSLRISAQHHKEWAQKDSELGAQLVEAAEIGSIGAFVLLSITGISIEAGLIDLDDKKKKSRTRSLPKTASGSTTA